MHLVRIAREERNLAERRIVTREQTDFEHFELFDQHNLYQVIHGDCTKLVDCIKAQDFTLIIADIPYGFKIKDSRFDDEPFKVKDYTDFIEGLLKVTTAKHWRLVTFHSSMQFGLVEACSKKYFGSPDQAGYENMVW